MRHAARAGAAVGRGAEVGVQRQGGPQGDAQRRLRPPVVDQPDLLGQRQGEQVREPEQQQGDGEEGGGAAGVGEGRCLGLLFFC